jgi:two-component sensor histidine kinase
MLNKQRGTHLKLLIALGATTILLLAVLLFVNIMELGKLAREDKDSYKENVIDQSSSLSRVIFAAHRLLMISPLPDEPVERTLERRFTATEELISHAGFVRGIDEGFLARNLGDDPLMLAERCAASDREYGSTLSRLQETQQLFEAAETFAGKEKLAEAFETQAADLLDLLQARASIMVQLEDYIFTVSRERVLEIFKHSRTLTASFAVLFCILATSFWLYLRYLFRTLAELSLHRNHLGELVEQRTAELSTANERLVSEIREREKAELSLRALLLEKETYLKEVYHRVKNNLNMVNSLIILQKAEIPEESRIFFNDLESRISAISLIHEKLYRSADLAGIDLGEYSTDLVQTIVHSLSRNPGKIKLEIAATGIQLPADILIPLGLIIAEVVTNSIKHGFKQESIGSITIKAVSSADRLFMVIGDDGTPPDSIEKILESRSLGAMLIQTLCQQLNGSLELSVHGGTSYSLDIPIGGSAHH